MKRYRRLQVFGLAVLVAELVLGLAGTPPLKEIFPFASWSLFSLVPYRSDEYDLILRTANGQPLEPPRSFGQAGGLVRQPHSIVTYQLIQQLGQAERTRNPAGSRALRQQIEEQFAAATIAYDLVRVTYAPVERWQTGRVVSTETLRSFRAGEDEKP